MAHPLKGKAVFIQTVTLYFTGKVVKVTKNDYVLTKAAWAADTGRFSNAMETGELNEVEPYGKDQEVRVNRGGIIAVSMWKHPLPEKQK
jgi:hypothetical protein